MLHVCPVAPKQHIEKRVNELEHGRMQKLRALQGFIMPSAVAEQNLIIAVLKGDD